MRGDDIHNNKIKLQQALQKVRTADNLNGNQQLILDFEKHCSTIGIGHSKRQKYTSNLRILSELSNVHFNTATKEDVKDLIYLIENTERWSDWTKHDYKVSVKRFYKWLKGNDEEYPNEV